jgi:hypothetical protein
MNQGALGDGGKVNPQKEALLRVVEFILERLKAGDKQAAQANYESLLVRKGAFAQLFSEVDEQYSALIGLTDLALRDAPTTSGGWDYLTEAQELVEEIRDTP